MSTYKSVGVLGKGSNGGDEFARRAREGRERGEGYENTIVFYNHKSPLAILKSIHYHSMCGFVKKQLRIELKKNNINNDEMNKNACK